MAQLTLDLSLRASCGREGLLLALVPGGSESVPGSRPFALLKLKGGSNAQYHYTFNVSDPANMVVSLIALRSNKQLLAHTKPLASSGAGYQANIDLRDCYGEADAEASRLINIYNTEGVITPPEMTLECQGPSDFWFWFSMVALAILILILLRWAYNKISSAPAQ